ncbi:MAG: DUF1616 domain-containing protein [Ktedonobacteraceae bacterium]|nr:DUF1616 domain-containing protein [Ktedonobacteraceae bacterium]
MRLKNLDLLVAISIATLNVIWAFLPYHWLVPGILLTVPMIFIIPGYVLTELLFHKRSLGTSYRLICSVSLSLAIDITGGFALNILPSGLQRSSWAMLLAVVTTLFALLAVVLRSNSFVQVKTPFRFRIAFHEYVLFGLSGAVLVLAIWYAVLGVVQQPRPGFTQLWLLPAKEEQKSCALRLGVHNFELTSMNYRVVLSAQGDLMKTWSPVTLASQQEWNTTETFATASSTNVSVKLQLYRLDRPESIYREVNVTLHGCAPPGASSRSTNSASPA